MDLKAFLKTRIATWLLGVILLFAMVVTAKILVEQHQVSKEIGKLQAQADKIKKDNSQLSDLINYFQTPQYEEKQAREKFNLKKDGEYVLSLPQNDSTSQAVSSESNPSNAKQWLDYFFNQK